MFEILGSAISFISSPYGIIYQVIGRDDGGNESVVSSTSSIIEANIQNLNDGEKLVLGRQDSLGYRTIIILTDNEIGLDDPVYDGNVEGRYIINYLNKYYRIMLEGAVQPTDLTSLGTPYYRYHAELIDFLYGIPPSV